MLSTNIHLFIFTKHIYLIHLYTYYPSIYLIHLSILSIYLSYPSIYLIHLSILSIYLSYPFIYLIYLSILSIYLSYPSIYLIHLSILYIYLVSELAPDFCVLQDLESVLFNDLDLGLSSACCFRRPLAVTSRPSAVTWRLPPDVVRLFLDDLGS